jgi:hypothetical protein
MAREVTGQRKAIRAANLLALALGAAAFGAVAIGALAIARLAVGRLAIKKARFGALSFTMPARPAIPFSRESRAKGSSSLLHPASNSRWRKFTRLNEFMLGNAQLAARNIAANGRRFMYRVRRAGCA